MNIPFFHLGRVRPVPVPEEHPLVRLHAQPHDTAEGGEFLDDAIHMDELQGTNPEISIASTSPDNLR